MLMSSSPTPASLHHLLRDEDLDQSRVAAGGGGMQRRPQLVVLRVDAGPPVQQDLHHLFVVVDATLRWAERDDSLEGSAQWLLLLAALRKQRRRERRPFIGSNILTSEVTEV